MVHEHAPKSKWLWCMTTTVITKHTTRCRPLDITIMFRSNCDYVRGVSREQASISRAIHLPILEQGGVVQLPHFLPPCIANLGIKHVST